MSPAVEHAVELALDDAAAAAVDALMDALEASGVVPIRAASRHAHPHVSLAVARDGEPAALAARLGGLAPAHLALELSSLGVFCTPEAVVFLGVTPHAALLELNAAVHARLDAGGVAVRDVYRPGAYVPHCTLAMHVGDPASAVRALAGAPLPIRASATALRVVEVPTGTVRAVVDAPGVRDV